MRAAFVYTFQQLELDLLLGLLLSLGLGFLRPLQREKLNRGRIVVFIRGRASLPHPFGSRVRGSRLVGLWPLRHRYLGLEELQRALGDVLVDGLHLEVLFILELLLRLSCSML